MILCDTVSNEHVIALMECGRMGPIAGIHSGPVRSKAQSFFIIALNVDADCQNTYQVFDDVLCSKFAFKRSLKIPLCHDK